MAEHTAQPTIRILLHLFRHLLPYRRELVLAATALLVAAGATLVMPILFRWLIDSGFADRAADSGAVETRVFVQFLGVAVVMAFASAFRFYLVSWLGERVSTDLRTAVFAHILRQDPVFFETLKTGDVQSRLSSDTTLVGSSISFGLRQSLLFTGGLVLLIWTYSSLALIMLAIILVIVVPLLILGRRLRALARRTQDDLATSGATANEILNAMQTVQSYTHEGIETQRYTASAEAAFASAVTRNRTHALINVVFMCSVFGAIVFVLWLGAAEVANGSMTPGLLTQFILYAGMVGASAAGLSEVYNEIQRAAGASERLFELLDTRASIVDGPLDMPETATDTGGMPLAFDEVTFRYPSRPAIAALEHVSFEVAAGETLALVGPSGAGKSTVFQLLLRFFDPSEGNIIIAGVPIRQLQLAALRRQIGFVSQESVVFSESVADNLRYGRPDATMDEIRAAARDAQALDFIEALPDGFDTYLGERGVRLSGGQRQRLSIARALLKNPPLLLLDEATSALDAASECQVQRALEHAMAGRTTLVIAHRLATIRNADRILVFDAGSVIECGQHDDLLAAGGLYARLAAMQFHLNDDPAQAYGS